MNRDFAENKRKSWRNLKENAVNNIIEINDFNAPELDVYARTSEVQLRRYNEPAPGFLLQKARR